LVFGGNQLGDVAQRLADPRVGVDRPEARTS
jgi:hypothetical protein